MTKSTFRLGVVVAMLAAFAGGWFCGNKPSGGVVGLSATTEPQHVIPEKYAVPYATATPRPAAAPAAAVPPSRPTFGDILKLNIRRDREIGLESFGRSLAQTNLNEALRLAGELTDHLDREAFLSGVIQSWSARDVDGALAYCLDQDFSLRCRLVPLAVAEMVRTRPEKALEMLRSLSLGEVHDRAAEALFTAWSAADPVTAARHMDTIQERALRSRILDSFGGEWSANDPPAALAWAASLQNPEDQSVAMNSALREYGRRFPADALQWAGEQMRGSNPLPGEMLASLLAEAGFASPREAFNQALSFGTHPRLKESLAAVASYYAEDKPAALLDNFRSLTPAQQKQVSPSVLFALGTASTQVPGELFNALGASEPQTEAVHAYIQGLAFRDSKLAEKWVQTLPTGALREAGQESLIAVANAASPNSPASAALVTGEH